MTRTLNFIKTFVLDELDGGRTHILSSDIKNPEKFFLNDNKEGNRREGEGNTVRLVFSSSNKRKFMVKLLVTKQKTKENKNKD